MNFGETAAFLKLLLERPLICRGKRDIFSPGRSAFHKRLVGNIANGRAPEVAFSHMSGEKGNRGFANNGERAGGFFLPIRRGEGCPMVADGEGYWEELLVIAL